MSTAPSPSGGLPGKWGYALVAAGVFVGMLLLANGICVRSGLPRHGDWTGIQPLEAKLDLLEEFSGAGEVDALLFGSSIVDFGFSAELFSELMTQELGREYRAFNFSTGAAEVRTFPRLYRLARTVSRPRSVFVVVPWTRKLHEELHPRGPDYALTHAPVGEVLDQPWLLALNRTLRSTGLVRSAPAAREALLPAAEPPARSPELYPLGPHGDRLSYRLWRAEDLPQQRRNIERRIRAFPAPASQPGDDPQRLHDERLDYYFARTDIAAMHELRELVEADGGQLYVVATAQAASFCGEPNPDPDVVRGSREYFELLAEQLGATRIDPTALVNLPAHDVLDPKHLNTHGARAFARATFARMMSRPELAREPELRPLPVDLFDSTDRSLVHSSLLTRPAHTAHPGLRVRLQESSHGPPLPTANVSVVLSTSDHVEITTPATKIGPGEYVAEVNLPSGSQPEAVMLRLMVPVQRGTRQAALRNFLVDYEWLTTTTLASVNGPPTNAHLGPKPLVRPASTASAAASSAVR